MWQPKNSPMCALLMALAIVPATAAAGEPAWQPAAYGDVAPMGELGRRVRLSHKRLEQYTPRFTLEGNEGWPGDREGRVLLGQVLTAKATGRKSQHADELVAGIKARLNERGYMGEVVPDDIADEQVLSGHSWLLRGLVAYQAWRRDETSLSVIRGIVTNLLLPTYKHYAKYPLTAEDRPRTGKADGTIVGKTINGWRLSSDIGCAFIMLDGATDVYDLLPSPELKALIELMIERFAKIDLLQVNAQTHASLSAARAILRFAPHADQAALVKLAARVFETYKAHGMTDHYANDNWFGRPLWTEGCAIIDSFDVAMLLWQATSQVAYLEDAQNIYFNGIGYNQRPSGGFGCDSCPGKNEQTLLHPKEPFEAYFCCSMRGGEGLARATIWSVMNHENEVLLTNLHDVKATVPLAVGEFGFVVKTAFPVAGQATLRVQKAPAQAVTLKIFLPSWVAQTDVTLKVNGKTRTPEITGNLLTLTESLNAESQIVLNFPIKLRSVAPVNAAAMPGHHVFRHGPLVLGAKRREGQTPLRLASEPAVLRSRRGRHTLKGRPRITLEPVSGLAFLSEKAARTRRHQIVFPSLTAP